jgi:transcriptional regulator with XRE-family HTH domain
MDYDRLSAELARALRGKRSQAAFARRLGCSPTVPYSWESGRRAPAASTFFRAAERVGVDPEAALARFCGGAWTADGDRVVRLLRAVVGGSSQQDAGELAGVGRQALGRWLRGSAEPRVPDLLRVVDRVTRRLPDFVAAFVDPEQVPSIRADWRELAAARALVASTPWAPAVALCLELDGYRASPTHPRGWIARQLGIEVALEDACLDLLVRAGRVREDRGRYVAVDGPPLDLRGAADPRRFWGEVALARAADGLVSWNLFTVSAADLDALRELQRDAFRRMRQRVEASAPSERVALAHWTLTVLAGGTDRLPDTTTAPGLRRNQ